MTNVSQSSSLAPTRHNKPPSNCNTQEKVLMILDHREPASRVRDTRQRTETHKFITNKNVSLKSVAKLLGVAKEILYLVN